MKDHNLRVRTALVGLSLLALLAGCGGTALPPTEPPAAPPTAPLPTAAPPTATPLPPTPTAAPELAISTTAFAPDGDIPVEYSCFGDNRSPALAWSGVPEGAESLVLIFYDPDAGMDLGASTPLGFAHWIIYNIPPESKGYAADVPAGGTLPDGASQGSNDFAPFAKPGGAFPGGAPIKVVGYDGPCPGGKHRYMVRLYALDRRLDLPPAATMSQVLDASEGHILAQAEMGGFFAPPR